MQELNVQPSNPTPYTPAGGTYNNNPVPGAGGLPSLSGLNNRMNPMAQEIQDQGRGEDSMLIHMTPDEVNSLQGLAMAHGGSLTINPETGLPEAGWLGKLLPMVLGAALAATGVGAPLAAGIVGAGQFARTGSLKKGLMAGLGAFSGAGLAGTAGIGGKLLGGNAGGLLGNNAGFFGANMGLGAAAPTLTTAAAGAGANTAAGVENILKSADMSSLGAGTGAGAGVGANTAAGVENILKSADMSSLGAGAAAPTVAPPAVVAGPMAKVGGGVQFTGGLGSRFAQATRAGLPGGTPGVVSKLAPKAALLGATSGVSGALSGRPSGGSVGSDGVIDNSYAGPYTAQKRKASFADNTNDILSSSKERRYFDVDMPEVYNVQGQLVQPGSSTARGTPIMQNVINPTAKKGQNRYNQILTPYMGGVDPEEEEGYAVGGRVNMRNGSFVVDARTVSELGNGSSNAGMEFMSRMGGRPLQGSGDGVSDSIRASIGGRQEARVARDEVLFPPEAVKRLGNGSAKKGTAKLYSLMNKAHKARKSAKRGQDTELRRGLA